MGKSGKGQDGQPGPSPSSTRLGNALRELLDWFDRDQGAVAAAIGVGPEKFRKCLSVNKFDEKELIRLVRHIQGIVKPSDPTTPVPDLWEKIRKLNPETIETMGGSLVRSLRKAGYELEIRPARPPRSSGGVGLGAAHATLGKAVRKYRRATGGVNRLAGELVQAMSDGDVLVLLCSDVAPLEWRGAGRAVLQKPIADAVHRGAGVLYLFPGDGTFKTAREMELIADYKSSEATTEAFDQFKKELPKAAAAWSADDGKRVQLKFIVPTGTSPLFLPSHNFALFCGADLGDPGYFATGAYPVAEGDDMVIFPLKREFADKMFSFVRMILAKPNGTKDLGFFAERLSLPWTTPGEV